MPLHSAVGGGASGQAAATDRAKTGSHPGSVTGQRRTVLGNQQGGKDGRAAGMHPAKPPPPHPAHARGTPASSTSNPRKATPASASIAAGPSLHTREPTPSDGNGTDPNTVHGRARIEEEQQVEEPQVVPMGKVVVKHVIIDGAKACTTRIGDGHQDDEVVVVEVEVRRRASDMHLKGLAFTDAESCLRHG